MKISTIILRGKGGQKKLTNTFFDPENLYDHNR